VLPVVRFRYENENGDGGAGGSAGSASGGSGGYGGMGGFGGVGGMGGFGGGGFGGTGGGLTGYGAGFNAAKDSQAANESLGLGVDGGFTGTVNLGLSPIGQNPTWARVMSMLQTTAKVGISALGIASGTPMGIASGVAGLADAASGLSFGGPTAASGTNSIGGDTDSGGFGGNNPGGGSGSGFNPGGTAFAFPAAVSSATVNPLKPYVPPGQTLPAIEPVIPTPTAVVSPSVPVPAPSAPQPQGSASLVDPSSGGTAKTTDWIALATLVVSGVALFSGK
jgi:hypothetical protein